MSTVETKVGQMQPGQRVILPTEYNGTHSGLLIALALRGPKAAASARRALLMHDDGSTVEVDTSADYTGWVEQESVELEALPCEGKVHTVFGREVSAADHHALRAVDADHPAPEPAQRKVDAIRARAAAAALAADPADDDHLHAVIDRQWLLERLDARAAAVAAERWRLALELERLADADADRLYRPKWQGAIRDAARFVRTGQL